MKNSIDNHQQFHFEDLNHKKIIQKFLKINDIRLKRVEESISQRSADFLEILPLLFHINHPLLPGFVSTQCPIG
ncbi:MAG: hypothetical protein DRQ43_04850, partial [Gammaproteobacteria bacterium]